MSSAKKQKRWAIIPPSSEASDAAAQRLSIEPDTSAPETLRSHRDPLGGRSTGLDSGEYEKISGRRSAGTDSWSGAEAGSGVSRRQKRRAKNKDVVSQKAGDEVDPAGRVPLRNRETLFEGFGETEVELDTWSPPEAQVSTLTTLVSPGQGSTREGSTGQSSTGEGSTGEGSTREGSPSTPEPDSASSSSEREERKRTGRRRVAEIQTQNSIPDAVLSDARAQNQKGASGTEGAPSRQTSSAARPTPERAMRGESENRRDDARRAETLTPRPPPEVSSSVTAGAGQTLRSKVTKKVNDKRSTPRRISRTAGSPAAAQAAQGGSRKRLSGESATETESSSSSKDLPTIPAPPWHEEES